MEDCNSNTPTGESNQVSSYPSSDQIKTQWAWLEKEWGGTPIR